MMSSQHPQPPASVPAGRAPPRRASQKKQQVLSPAQKLEQDNARMEERLMALKSSLAKQKEKMKATRTASAGIARSKVDPMQTAYTWKSGRQGTLGSHAKEVLRRKNAILQSRGISFAGIAQQAEEAYRNTLLSRTTSVPEVYADVEVSSRYSTHSADTIVRPQDKRLSSNSGNRSTWSIPSVSSSEQSLNSRSSDISLHSDNSHAIQTQQSSRTDKQAQIQKWTVPTLLAQQLQVVDLNGDATVQIDRKSDTNAQSDIPSRIMSYQSFYVVPTECLQQSYSSVADPIQLLNAMSKPSSDWHIDDGVRDSILPGVPVQMNNETNGGLLKGMYNEAANRADFEDALNAWRNAGKQPFATTAESNNDHRTKKMSSMPVSSLMEGEYDEVANDASFQKALNAWRNGNNYPLVDSTDAVAKEAETTVNFAAGTNTDGDLDKQRSTLSIGIKDDVHFHDSVSYMQRLQLKKLRTESDAWTSSLADTRPPKNPDMILEDEEMTPLGTEFQEPINSQSDDENVSTDTGNHDYVATMDKKYPTEMVEVFVHDVTKPYSSISQQAWTMEDLTPLILEPIDDNEDE